MLPKCSFTNARPIHDFLMTGCLFDTEEPHERLRRIEEEMERLATGYCGDPRHASGSRQSLASRSRAWRLENANIYRDIFATGKVPPPPPPPPAYKPPVPMPEEFEPVEVSIARVRSHFGGWGEPSEPLQEPNQESTTPPKKWWQTADAPVPWPEEFDELPPSTYRLAEQRGKSQRQIRRYLNKLIGGNEAEAHWREGATWNPPVVFADALIVDKFSDSFRNRQRKSTYESSIDHALRLLREKAQAEKEVREANLLDETIDHFSLAYAICGGEAVYYERDSRRLARRFVEDILLKRDSLDHVAIVVSHFGSLVVTSPRIRRMPEWKSGSPGKHLLKISQATYSRKYGSNLKLMGEMKQLGASLRETFSGLSLTEFFHKMETAGIWPASTGDTPRAPSLTDEIEEVFANAQKVPGEPKDTRHTRA